MYLFMYLSYTLVCSISFVFLTHVSINQYPSMLSICVWIHIYVVSLSTYLSMRPCSVTQLGSCSWGTLQTRRKGHSYEICQKTSAHVTVRLRSPMTGRPPPAAQAELVPSASA